MTTTFQSAVEDAGRLLERIDSNETSLDSELPGIIEYLKSEETARGFFVALLTGDSRLPNSLPASFVRVMQSSEIACDLLVKNLVMSTNMSLTHERNNKREMASLSRRVASRAQAIIRAVGQNHIQKFTRAMQSAILVALSARGTCKSDAAPECGDETNPLVTRYVQFLNKWNYDIEQLSLCKEQLDKLF
ncbi:MAG TPA: hypothetical protein V6D17_18750 [Candidatus Obscuribacterales bacterium]